MSDLFDNAIDSLKVGIEFYLQENYKHAILNIYHSIELFLKEKLFIINPILIYKNIDKPINDDSLTVSLNDILSRFSNLSICLEKEKKIDIINLQRRRNQIEHYKFTQDNIHYYIIGKALNFLYYFLPEHLTTNIEEHIDENHYREMRDIILEYEEKLQEANVEVKKRTTPKTQDDLCNTVYVGECPECGNNTVVIGTEKGDFCFFCYEKIEDMLPCNYCGEYKVRNEFFVFGVICNDCFDYKMSKD